jgi:hypothetical protein
MHQTCVSLGAQRERTVGRRGCAAGSGCVHIASLHRQPRVLGWVSLSRGASSSTLPESCHGRDHSQGAP